MVSFQFHIKYQSACISKNCCVASWFLSACLWFISGFLSSFVKLGPNNTQLLHDTSAWYWIIVPLETFGFRLIYEYAIHAPLLFVIQFFFFIIVNMICWDLFSITFTCIHLRHYFYYTQNDLYYAQNGPVVVKNIVFLDLLLWFLSTWFHKFNVSYIVEYMKLRAWMEIFVISFRSCLVFLVSLLARFCLIIYLFLIGW